MPTRRLPEFWLVVGLAVVAGVVALVVLLRADGSDERRSGPVSWRGLVGAAHPVVPTEQRQIVLLRTPSVAQRVARAGRATEEDHRRWSAQAHAAQESVLTKLVAQGVGVRPEHSFTRVVNGFSAMLDPRALAILESEPEVLGVYPVRAAFPAALSRTALAAATAAPAELPGYDGTGVTIALLDTGVDRLHPYLGGRVERGLDLLGGAEEVEATENPQVPGDLERHGTELAGLLVGSDGPDGMRGIAPGAHVLPIRVAGWQPDAEGRSVVYARTDQLIAGLERAVDPDGDGDAHDAARIALVGLAVPFASFGSSPEAQAAAGALALDTLVVAPAGNDGAAGPLFGAIGGPGGSAAALTVGATDERPEIASVHVVMRRGLDVVHDGWLPLLASRPTGRGELELGLPRVDRAGGVGFFDRRGLSLVAGRAAVAPAGDDPAGVAIAAARAGAAAVLLYGKSLPAGSLGLSTDLGVPVVAVPAAAVRALVDAHRAGQVAAVALGGVRDADNERRNRVAAFSSRGLSSGGLVKPDLVAPGVGLPTAGPGTAATREPSFATLNGTSAAAASVAGAAALLAQARPALDARDLAGLLTGYARPLPGATPVVAGAGGLDLGASAAGELVPLTRSLAFGAWTGPSWRSERTIFVRNVSSRRLRLTVDAVPTSESEQLRFVVEPRRALVRPGRTVTFTVRARASGRPGVSAATGVIAVKPAGGQPLRIPWAIGFPREAVSLVPSATIEPTSFAPSDLSPATLTVRAGRLLGERGGGIQIQPVERLDVLLYKRDGAFVGLLARVRDVLPGTYSFGITGRGPSGARLEPGGYELRLVAWPTLLGEPSRTRVRFEIA